MRQLICDSGLIPGEETKQKLETCAGSSLLVLFQASQYVEIWPGEGHASSKSGFLIAAWCSYSCCFLFYGCC